MFHGTKARKVSWKKGVRMCIAFWVTYYESQILADTSGYGLLCCVPVQVFFVLIMQLNVKTFRGN